MERLAKRGHEVNVVDFDIDWRNKGKRTPIQRRFTKKASGKVIKGTAITVVRPPIIRAPYLDILSEARMHSAEIEWQLSRFRPDVVVSLGIINAYIGSLICKRVGIPHVYYLIDSLETLVQNPGFKGFARGLIANTLRSSTSIIVINEELGKYARRLGADPSHITVLGAGVDTTRINPSVSGAKIRSKLGITDNDFAMLFMGWTYTFSGVKEVADALANIAEPKLRLLVLGRGDLTDYLARLREERLKDQLIIVPWKPYEEIPMYLASADVCLLPSYKNEVMRNIVPIKMYEYLAAGKPVISTSLPGIRAEFGENSGVIYVDKPESAIDAAMQLSENPSRLKLLSTQAVSFVADRSWDKITSKFESILMEHCRAISVRSQIRN
jgi:glycosyltransferase involved in cell wall biosynthesis